MWPPTESCRLRLEGSSNIRIDGANLRYWAETGAGQCVRCPWGGKHHSKLEEAWRSACQHVGIEADSADTKARVALAIEQKSVRTPSKALEFQQGLALEKGAVVEVEDEDGAVIAEIDHQQELAPDVDYWDTAMDPRWKRLRQQLVQCMYTQRRRANRRLGLKNAL